MDKLCTNKDIPESKIVENNRAKLEENEFSSQFECYATILDELYCKYIQSGSEFEINIDYQLRKRCGEIMTKNKDYLLVKKDKNKGQINLSVVHESIQKDRLFEILKLLDRCNKNNISLMNGSFMRFRQTKEFDQLYRLIFL